MPDEVVVTTRDIYDVVLGMKAQLEHSMARTETHGEAIGAVRAVQDNHDLRIRILEQDAAVAADRETRDAAGKSRQPGWWAVAVAAFVGVLGSVSAILTVVSHH